MYRTSLSVSVSRDKLSKKCTKCHVCLCVCLYSTIVYTFTLKYITVCTICILCGSMMSEVTAKYFLKVVVFVRGDINFRRCKTNNIVLSYCHLITYMEECSE